MQSLRLKFVLFAMAAVSVLLLILGISINGLAWYMFEQQADEMMETLIDPILYRPYQRLRLDPFHQYRSDLFCLE